MRFIYFPLYLYNLCPHVKLGDVDCHKRLSQGDDSAQPIDEEVRDQWREGEGCLTDDVVGDKILQIVNK